MTENMIAYLICLACALLFVILGFACFWAAKKGKVVGFFSNVKPPEPEELSDVAAFDRAVGKLWIAAGITFALLFLPLLFSQDDSPLILLSIIGSIFWAIGLIVIYLQGIEKKYRTRRK